MNVKGKLSRDEKSWILYDVANSSYGLVVMTAVMPLYYKNYIAADVAQELSTADWGFANAAAGLLVALCAPLLGAFADARGNKRNMLAFFMLMGVAATASFALVEPGMRMTTLLLYAVSLAGFAGGNIFYDAMLPDVTNHRRMDFVSSAGYAWGYIGGAIPFIMFILLYLLLPSGSWPMRLSFLITAIWWGVFSIPVLRIRTRGGAVTDSNASFLDALRRLRSTCMKIGKHRNIVIFLLAYFLYIDGVDTIIRMAIPYGSDIGMGVGMLMATVLGLQIAAFPFALIYASLAKRHGTRRMLYVAIMVYMLITFLAFLLPGVDWLPGRYIIFFLVALLIASSQGGIQALSRSFFGRLIPREQAAEFFGFYNIFGKFATILGPFLIGAAGRWLGHARYGMLSLVFLFIAGALLLAFVREEKPARKRGSTNP